MPTREAPSYSSSRVQRASRLNSLEQVRLQQRLMLLEKARLHQARLTNQDIRLTSVALDYILNCSGHSPEGRGPEGQQGGTDPAQTEDPCFLYGERVVSRKVRRMPRPQSAVERATFRRDTQDGDSSVSGGEDSTSLSTHRSLPPRPQSSPAKGRSWGWSHAEMDDASGGGGGGGGGSDPETDRPHSRGKSPSPLSPGASRPATAGSGGGRAPSGRGGRVTPHQAWEDHTDDVTKRLLKAQKQQQQRQQEQLQQQQQQEQTSPFSSSRRRSNRYLQDIQRMQQRSQTPRSARTFPKQSSSSSSSSSYSRGVTPADPDAPFAPATPSPRVPSPGSGAVIEDRIPVSPRQKRARSTGVGRRAGLAEIMNQARVTMSASAWRSHLASTQVVPRSMESQRQVILEVKKNAERQRQEQVMGRVKSFMGQLQV